MSADSATQVWFRNPGNYIRECVEVGASRIAWDRGFLHKRNIDAQRHANLYFPASVDYRLLLIGDQGTAELTRDHGLANPKAVYPTWVFGEDDLTVLEELLEHPAGDDMHACSDRGLAPDERPVLGQEHRVVVTDTPTAASSVGKRFFSMLAELQAEYPDAIVHVHGLYSFRIAFGMGYGSADCEPRTLAWKGGIALPNGRAIPFEEAQENRQWVELIGFTPKQLEVPRNRCMFNIRSAMWAGANFTSDVKFRTRGGVSGDPFAKPGRSSGAPATRRIATRTLKPKVGDKVICDTCSLVRTCKYFRVGSVCSVPDSDGAKLAQFFKSRDSNTIIDGLADLLETNAERLALGRANELADGKIDKEVTRIIESMARQGTNLAKLVDPSLRAGGAPQVGININAGAIGQGTSVQVGTPQEIAAQAVAILEAHGYTRDEISTRPELLEAVMSGKPIPPKAIEASST